MGLLYRKVGRLYPGKDDLVHVVRDESGELGVINPDEMREIVLRDPEGRDLGEWHTIVIPVGEEVEFLALAGQVRNMLEKWPERKAALWVREEG